MNEVVYAVAMGQLCAAGLLALTRIVRARSSLADRVIGLDLLLVTIGSGVALFAAHTGDAVFFEIVVAAALLGFVTTATVARFVERRGAR